jgi:fructose-1,6-bisphosphatase I
MTDQAMTFGQFLQNDGLDHDLTFLLEDIATACRVIADHVRRGALTGNLGSTSSTNIQGETQKQLDVIANDEFVKHCSTNSRIAALVSEEVDEVYWLKSQPAAGDYLVYFDPLDGSSNLNVNLSVGTIFSIIRIDAPIDPTDEASVLIAGSKQICAGYSVYGPSTSLVLTTGNGVNGFTHDLSTDEFILSHMAMTIPAQTDEFAINASRYRHWDTPIRRYIDECLAGPDGPRAKSFNMRWAASMVADIHRILVRGGVFLYPADADNRAKGGKLRLMYEANPMGMIVEQAGGGASTGAGRILDVTPTSHHQRVPVLLGSKAEIDLLDSYHAE